jgi:hypothetical protein
LNSYSRIEIQKQSVNPVFVPDCQRSPPSEAKMDVSDISL